MKNKNVKNVMVKNVRSNWKLSYFETPEIIAFVHNVV